jgi:hypothetical protein
MWLQPVWAPLRNKPIYSLYRQVERNTLFSSYYYYYYYYYYYIFRVREACDGRFVRPKYVVIITKAGKQDVVLNWSVQTRDGDIYSQRDGKPEE